jgi:hypothetical protein
MVFLLFIVIIVPSLFCCSKLTTIFYLSDRKIADDSEEVTLGFVNKNSSTMSDLSKGPDSKADPIQMPPLSFSKVSTGCEFYLNLCVGGLSCHTIL